MLITRPDAPHILPRRAVEPEDRRTDSTGRFQQLTKRLPVIAPIGLKPNSTAQLVGIDFPPLPFVNDVLVTGNDRLNTQDNGSATPGHSVNELGRKSLRSGQGVVISNQNDIALRNASFKFGKRQYTPVCAECFTEFSQVLATRFCIRGTDGSRDFRERMQLRRTSAEPQ
jgi:hypothetical protein